MAKKKVLNLYFNFKRRNKNSKHNKEKHQAKAKFSLTLVYYNIEDYKTTFLFNSTY